MHAVCVSLRVVTQHVSANPFQCLYVGVLGSCWVQQILIWMSAKPGRLESIIGLLVGGATGTNDATVIAMLKVIITMLNNHHTEVSEAFDNMFAPTISELSQRSHQVTKVCTEAYNPVDRPSPDQLWCMVLGRYLDKSLIKSCHIYKRKWPAVYAVS